MTQDGAGKLGEEALDEVEPGAVLGRERKVEAACRSCVEPGSGFPRYVCGMIVEDQLDRGAGRIGGIEKLEEFDELAAAVAISDERVDLAGEQINPGQQAERAMTFALMIAREGRMNVRHGWQIRRRRSDDLDARLLVVGDDRCRLRRLLRFGGGLFQDLDLAVDTQNLRHLLLELGVAPFQVVAHLVRLDVLLAEDLAHRALDQMGETFVPCRRSALARMTGQKPRRPQLVRIAVLLGLIARQRYQPAFASGTASAGCSAFLSSASSYAGSPRDVCRASRETLSTSSPSAQASTSLDEADAPRSADGQPGDDVRFLLL